MLKNRIAAVLPVKNDIVVQSLGFERYLPVGRPEIAVEYLNRWGIDEIVMLDMDKTAQGQAPDVDRVGRCSSFCQVPLTVGGGIRSVAQIAEIIKSGADKVAVNNAFFANPRLISEGARRFGIQCMVVSMDVRKVENGYETATHSGSRPTGLDPCSAARLAEESGAGEILLNSIDRDGAKTGYDLELLREVCDAVKIPVIACGGVGRPAHFLEGVRAGASAVCAGNFFHFNEHSVILAKRWLTGHDADVRLDSYADYSDFAFGYRDRTTKRDDAYLERLRFEYVPEETI